jgi:hypothetical protein
MLVNRLEKSLSANGAKPRVGGTGGAKERESQRCGVWWVAAHMKGI